MRRANLAKTRRPSPLVPVIAAVATLFGAYDQTSGAAALFALPIAAWGFSLGVWMTFRGFTPSEITDAPNLEPVSADYAHAAA